MHAFTEIYTRVAHKDAERTRSFISYCMDQGFKAVYINNGWVDRVGLTITSGNAYYDSAVIGDKILITDSNRIDLVDSQTLAEVIDITTVYGISNLRKIHYKKVVNNAKI